MISLTLIGIGAGSSDHLTIQAIRAINSADLILIPRKGTDKCDLAELRHRICAEVLKNPDTGVVEFDMPERDAAHPDYRQGVEDWHDAVARVWHDEISSHLGRNGRVAFLVWGDPSLYDSTLRLADRVSRLLPVKVSVVPGITSIHALAAAHAVTLNRVGGAFTVTTGRLLREKGWPDGVDTMAVMLDGECSFRHIPAEGVHIWWGAYLGMVGELLASGPLSETGPDIVALREAARAERGWIMDVYLLRREAGTYPYRRSVSESDGLA